MLNNAQCQQARQARDRRFDGLFYIAVRSTGIYCRPICPAKTASEAQVQYYPTAIAAAAAGFRPCLRCRPESAPGSPAWLGSHTTLKRAIKLIHEGALADGDLEHLCSRLGISSRYLRKLFQQHLGLAPKAYALYQQILFAKQLLHQTPMPIADIALQAGFHSIRRFNDAFKQQLQLTPSQVRGNNMSQLGTLLSLELAYRPPLNWPLLLQFWQRRTLQDVEWLDAQHYGRTFAIQQRAGWFEVQPIADKAVLQLKLHWPYPDGLAAAVSQIRRMLDLDADMLQIEQHLQLHLGEHIHSGLRIPGVWNAWEAAVRAILGQQVSVAGARTQLNRLCQALGQPLDASIKSADPVRRLFPTPAQVAASDLQMIKVPQARRDTLHQLARFVLENPAADPDSWLSIKGIGPWTVGYSKMRGLSDTDIWLAGDLGVQKALQHRPVQAADLSPWRSYATFQLWFGLNQSAIDIGDHHANE